MSDKILIPEGWTYFAHRTNMERWSSNPFEMDVIDITKLMSVVTERDIYEERKNYGNSHRAGYSIGSGTPFEIRCLIGRLDYVSNMSDKTIKNIMLKEFYYDRNNMGGAYGQRHHSIPKGEELVVIGIGNYDEVNESEKRIIWTIPRRFLKLYKEDLKKNNIRVIELNNVDYEDRRSNGK